MKNLSILALLLFVHRGASGQSAEVLAVVGATILPSPTEQPIANGVVVVRGGKIAAVGSKEAIAVPSEATLLNAVGLYVTAGFQNSHVHFTEPKWEGAAEVPAERLSAQLEEMLLRYGFITVVDTGSDLQNTTALRRRIESGEVRGPRILTAGTPFYPVDGIPYYLKGLPPELLSSLNTPGSGDEARAIARRQLDSGADIVKLFTGSWVERGRVLPMSPGIAGAAAEEAHQKGRLVFSHASNIAGLEVALEAGVDVIAHALDDERGWNESHVARMKSQNTAMIPTLKLFGGQSYTKYIQQEVADLAGAGGVILFGTDVGYMTDYDPTEEYVLMAGAGLDWRQILAALTTAPSERFREEGRRGRIAPGMDADLVVLASDPANDVSAFARVRYAVRRGRLVYSN
jgi:imidazolonepropionase-like amidohydrolase